MPAAGVDFPLVQLFGELASTAPYDFSWNAMHGVDIEAIYGGLSDAVGGIDAHTRYEALASEAALKWMKRHYASGIGPWKGNVLPRDGSPPHPLLSHALNAGLVVHPYTLRTEELPQVPVGIDSPVVAEAVQLYRLGAHGFFIDQPDLGVAARDLFGGVDKT